jgi:hypothetical protein
MINDPDDIELNGFMLEPITNNLDGSFVDPDKLISIIDPNYLYPVGMANFRSKNNTSPLKYPQIATNAKISPNNNRTITKQARRASNLNSKMLIKQKEEIFAKNRSKAAKLWHLAFKKVKVMKDPWVKFHIGEDYPVEHVIRHRYNPCKKEWKKDECVVRMQTKQFANGSMRTCYRL